MARLFLLPAGYHWRCSGGKFPKKTQFSGKTHCAKKPKGALLASNKLCSLCTGLQITKLVYRWLRTQLHCFSGPAIRTSTATRELARNVLIIHGCMKRCLV